MFAPGNNQQLLHQSYLLLLASDVVEAMEETDFKAKSSKRSYVVRLHRIRKVVPPNLEQTCRKFRYTNPRFFGEVLVFSSLKRKRQIVTNKPLYGNTDAQACSIGSWNRQHCSWMVYSYLIAAIYMLILSDCG